jgi:transposase
MTSGTQAGIDVSAATLDGTRQGADGGVATEQFANTAAGHRRLGRWLAAGGGPVRVMLEATGVYHREVTRFLAAQPGVEVMVANPRTVAAFARATQPRTRTDRTMAGVLCAAVGALPFRPWQPPPAAAQQLQVVARRIAQLIARQTEEKNRWHAYTVSGDAPAAVVRDVRRELRALERRLTALTAEAQRVIAGAPPLQRAQQRLTSVKGIAQASSIQLLGELAGLPPDLTARQWVATAGLDVRRVESGTSVHRRPRLSKIGNARIRAALYLPALTALQHEPHVHAFHQQLLARHKAPQQAVVAVMRKLLHAIYGMLKTDTDFDGAKFRRLSEAPAAP